MEVDAGSGSAGLLAWWLKVGEEEVRGKACPHAGGCGLGLRPGRMSPVAGGLGEMNGASPPLARAAARATQCLPLSLNLPIARPPAVRRPISKKSHLG